MRYMAFLGGTSCSREVLLSSARSVSPPDHRSLDCARAVTTGVLLRSALPLCKFVSERCDVRATNYQAPRGATTPNEYPAQADTARLLLGLWHVSERGPLTRVRLRREEAATCRWCSGSCGHRCQGWARVSSRCPNAARIHTRTRYSAALYWGRAGVSARVD